MTKHTVGIDISKVWLDAFAAPEGRASRFSNDPTGFRKLIAWIGSGIDQIAYEPTGPFHRDFEDTLLKAGLPLYPINPFQVRSFARSLGGRAKTDAVDARMLATMAAAIERQLKRVDAEIQQRLQAEETLERRAEILTSIPGISDITAAGLIVHMPELGTLTGARAASLAGLAPVTRESGSWKGHSFIQGGRHQVRRLLYMPAGVAIRYNPDLKRKYEALVANGKPRKVALTAVMRKLLVLANTLVQQDRIWTAHAPGKYCCPVFPTPCQASIGHS